MFPLMACSPDPHQKELNWKQLSNWFPERILPNTVSGIMSILCRFNSIDQSSILNFDLRKEGDERYVFHRSWVKTDEEGRILMT